MAIYLPEATRTAVDTLTPSNGFTNTDYQNFATTFDTLIFPLDTLNFGVPSQIDVQVQGRDRAANQQIAKTLQQRLADIPGVVDAHVQRVARHHDVVADAQVVAGGVVDAVPAHQRHDDAVKVATDQRKAANDAERAA